MLYILTGKGKGKTTSAIGMGIRAAGAEKKVLMIQFLKTKNSSEKRVLDKIDNFSLKSFGRKGFFLPKEELEKNLDLKKHFDPLVEKDKKLARKGLNFAKDQIESENCDILILDEVCVALDLELIEAKDLLSFIDKFVDKVDIVLTGRGCSEKIIEKADLVTEMREVKHYFNNNQKEKRGIEY